MVESIFYLVLAALGLGLLIFIHELGHYWMARRVGMTVEAFAIGFGKPIFTWEHKGVKWHFCWLPFGGYVRIAGMEKKGSLEPYQIPNGFYGKKPFDRIKVAFMGPFVNIVFALLAFSIIWATGGREKPFSELTRIIGWVDPHSKLYEEGLRPGDEITFLNQAPFEGFNDLLFASILNEKTATLQGTEINYLESEKKPFTFSLDISQDLKGIERKTMTIGILSPASYLIYDRHPDGRENMLRPGSPMENSGIQYKDRIVWVDGHLIFSTKQLIEVINQPKVLLTVEREGKTFLTLIPRLKISDIRLTRDQKAELDDWQHAAKLKTKVQQLFFIPYNLTEEAIVESANAYIDEQSEEHVFEETARTPLSIPLQKGDRIVAVDGMKIHSSIHFLTEVQQKKVHLIVERGKSFVPISWKQADSNFETQVNPEELKHIVSTIGTDYVTKEAGSLVLLSPVIPKLFSELPLTAEEKAWKENQIQAQKKEIEEIEDPKKKTDAERLLEESQKKLMLGIALQDREVIYNPSPIRLTKDVFEQTWRTIANLFSGELSPKWMSGPVGIVQVIHYGWMMGIKEALFWMGVISLNLAIINLLPLPVLDGGHICFSVVESITKKPIKAKTMEKMIIPFIVLLIALFIYLTYNDLLRLFTRFF